MKVYHLKKNWKYSLLLAAVIISSLSLYYTNSLVEKMKVEERNKMEVWAGATRFLALNNDLSADVGFYVNIISNNKTIPVFLVNPEGGVDSIISAVNIKASKIHDKEYLQKRLAEIKDEHESIVIDLAKGDKNIIYYDDSILLRQLSIYPFVQLGIISIFILIAYFAFSASRKAEQNQVWVGMAKETAHQLGTPISSLNAWIELLGQNPDNADYVPEMEKDVERLNTVVERFSKVGSIPELPLSDLCQVLSAATKYMRTRASSHINITLRCGELNQLIIPLNIPLFYWVIENMVKNSIDAMNGKGEIDISLKENKKSIEILISDTGRGIPKKLHKTIFKPGYTSKDRGWGLGLSLVKRIVENYHNGKIQVQSSDVDQGTTFKVELPKGE